MIKENQRYQKGVGQRPSVSGASTLPGRHGTGQNGRISRSVVLGEVLELANRHDLGLTKAKVNVRQLLNEFIASRRQGLSPHTIAYYRQYLTPLLLLHELTPQSITEFLAGLPCNAGGKLAYYRATRAFCNWLVRNDYIKDSPLKKVDPPKPLKPILPSMTREQVDYLIGQVEAVRDKAILGRWESLEMVQRKTGIR